MLSGAAGDGKLRLCHGRTMACRYAGHPFVDKGYGAPYLEGARRDRLFAGASSRGFNIPLHLDIASEAGQVRLLRRRPAYTAALKRGPAAEARRVM
jgi:hypothetical protein